MAENLAHDGPLTAGSAQDGERLVPGRIYVAPADHHLLATARGSAELRRAPARAASDPRSTVCSAVPPRRTGRPPSGWVLSGGLATASRVPAPSAAAVAESSSRTPTRPGSTCYPGAAVDRATDIVLPAADIAGKLRRLTAS